MPSQHEVQILIRARNEAMASLRQLRNELNALDRQIRNLAGGGGGYAALGRAATSAANTSSRAQIAASNNATKTQLANIRAVTQQHAADARVQQATIRANGAVAVQTARNTGAQQIQLARNAGQVQIAQQRALSAAIMAQGRVQAAQVQANARMQIAAAQQAARAQQQAQAAQMRAAQQAAGHLDRLSAQFSHLSQNTFFAGAALTAAFTVPLVAAGKAVVSFGSQWEDAFAGVRKTTFDTSKTFAENEVAFAGLEQQLRTMATDTLPVTREEIAGVAQVAGQLGIAQGDIAGFTDAMIRMGESSNLTATEAAEAFARLGNLMDRDTGPQIAELASAVAGLGVEFAATESEIVNMAFRIAGAGKQIGLADSQILAFATGLASLGVRAELGGSSISRVFQEIAVAVEEGGAQLQTFARVAGQSSEEFAASFQQDAGSAILDFVDGLAAVRDAGDPVFSILDELSIDGIRVSDILLRMAGNTDLFREAFAIGGREIQNTAALTRISEERFKTFNAQLQLVKNRLSEIAVDLFMRLRPTLLGILDFVDDAGAKFAQLVDAFGNLPDGARNVLLAFTGLLAIVGPLLVALSGIFSVIAASIPIWGSLAGGVGVATGALVGIVAVIPVIIAAIVLLAVKWDDFSRNFPHLAHAIEIALDGIVIALKAVVVALDLAYTAVVTFGEIFLHWIDAAIGAIPGLISGIGEIGSKLLELQNTSSSDLGLNRIPILEDVPIMPTQWVPYAAKKAYEEFGDDAGNALKGLVQGNNDLSEAVERVNTSARTQHEIYQELVAKNIELINAEGRRGTTIEKLWHQAGNLARAEADLAQSGHIVIDTENQIVAALAATEKQMLDTALASGFIQAAVGTTATQTIAEVKLMERETIRAHTSMVAGWTEIARTSTDGGLAIAEQLGDVIASGAITAGDAFNILRSSGVLTFKDLSATLQELVNGAHAEWLIAMATGAEGADALKAKYQGYAEVLEFARLNQSLLAQESFTMLDAWQLLGQGISKASEQIGIWEQKNSNTQRALEFLDEELRVNGSLTEEQARQYETLTWFLGRTEGGIRDTSKAFVDLQTREADLTREMDTLNQQFKDGVINQADYDAAIKDITMRLDPAAGAMQNFADVIGGSTTIMQGIVEDIRNILIALGLLEEAPPATPEVSLDDKEYNDRYTDIKERHGKLSEEKSAPHVSMNRDEYMSREAELRENVRKIAEINEAVKIAMNAEDFFAEHETVRGVVDDLSNPTLTQAQIAVKMMLEEFYSGHSEVLTVIETMNGLSVEIPIVFSGGTTSESYVPPPPAGGSYTGGGGPVGYSAMGAAPQMQAMGGAGAALLGGKPGRQLLDGAPTREDVALAREAQGNAQEYANVLKEVVGILADANETMGDADEGAKAFAEAGKASIEALLAALDFLDKLGSQTIEFGEFQEKNIASLKFTTEKIVRSLAESAALFSTEGLEATKVYGEAAKSGSEGMTAALEFLNTLGDKVIEYGPWQERNIANLKFTAEKIVASMGDSAALFSGPFLEHTKLFAEAVEASAGAMSTALQFLMDMGGETVESVIEAEGLYHLVERLAERSHLIANQFGIVAGHWDDTINDEIEAFATAVEASTGALSAALSFLLELAAEGARSAIEAEGLYHIIQRLAERAGLIAHQVKRIADDWDVEVTPAMESFGTAVEASSGALGSTLALLIELNKEGTETVIEVQGLYHTVARLAERAGLIAHQVERIARDWDVNVTPAMESFANAVSASTGALGETLTLLKELNTLTEFNYMEVGEIERAADLLSERAKIIALAFQDSAAGWIETVTPALESFANAVGASITAVGDTLTFLIELGKMTEFNYLEAEEVRRAAQLLAERARIIADAFKEAADGWDETVTPAIEEFAKAAGASLELISAVPDALKAMLEIVAMEDIDIAEIAALIAENTMLLLETLREASAGSEEWVKELGDWAENAGKSLELVGNVASAMNAVAEVSEITKGDVKVFKSNIMVMLQLVRELKGLAEEYLQDALTFQALMEAIAAAMQAAANAMSAVTGDSADSGGGAAGDSAGGGGGGLGSIGRGGGGKNKVPGKSSSGGSSGGGTDAAEKPDFPTMAETVKRLISRIQGGALALEEFEAQVAALTDEQIISTVNALESLRDQLTEDLAIALLSGSDEADKFAAMLQVVQAALEALGDEALAAGAALRSGSGSGSGYLPGTQGAREYAEKHGGFYNENTGLVQFSNDPDSPYYRGGSGGNVQITSLPSGTSSSTYGSYSSGSTSSGSGMPDEITIEMDKQKVGRILGANEMARARMRAKLSGR